MALLCADAAKLLNGAGADELEPDGFSLLELLVEAVTVYSPVFDLAGKTLRLDARCGTVEAFGVRNRVFRAVSNLLDNGLKHTSSRSVVSISCADVFNEFAITVSDDGPRLAEVPTVSPVTIETFIAAIRGGSDPSADFAPGTGLKFVSEIVAMHGGRSTVERNDRGGTKFTLIFPKG
ncbi:MAG: ATP-binding protein [Chloroflexi bacterium]|nr:ATP-binding protein [Chloroflexota bacterium]